MNRQSIRPVLGGRGMAEAASNQLTIRQHLVRNNLRLICFVIGIGLLVVVTVVYSSLRSSLVDTYMSEVRGFAEFVAPAVMFDDAESARDSLQALSERPETMDAKVVLPDGAQNFASAQSTSKSLPGFMPAALQSAQLSAPVSFRGQALGTVELRISLFGIFFRTMNIALAIFVAMGVVLVLAYLGLGRLNRHIVDPLQSLSQRMDAAAESGEYMVESAHSDIAEIDHLGQRFNEFLSAIADREARIETLVNFDPLTGLPNRRGCNNQLERVLAGAARRQSAVAVLYLDLDEFKVVNDTLGHQVGDSLLCEIAQRLTAVVRRNHHIGRLGGDEFIVIVDSLDEPGDAFGVAERIREAIAKPVHVGQNTLYCSTSIGIACFPRDGDSPNKLLAGADAAMYTAKQAGRNQSRFHDSQLAEQVQRKSSIMQAMRVALERGDFRLEYQPIVSVGSDEISAFEALMRWDCDAVQGLHPGEFIPIAESSGFIVQLGAWALRRACKDAMDFAQHAGRPIRVSVNISPAQIFSPGFVDSVRAVLKDTGLRPANLELEVTETVVMQRKKSAKDPMDELAELGILMSLDDFGTGYSSMSYLKQLPISRLKIDREFIFGLPSDQEDLAIVQAVVALAKTFGLKVTAEGVESAQQQDLLIDHGCNELQGFLYSPSMKPDAVKALLVQSNGKAFLSSHHAAMPVSETIQ